MRYAVAERLGCDEGVRGAGGGCWPQDVSRLNMGCHADESEMVNVSDLAVSDIANLYLEAILGSLSRETNVACMKHA